MISCRGLSKRFLEKDAVTELHFDVEPGVICGFLGPNGAGKSTTVHMLTGLLRPAQGEAWVGGVRVEPHSLELRRQIGVLPEGLGLFDALTVEEHLLLSGPLYGLSRKETRQRAEELLELLSLQEARQTFADQCSYGTRKKTALALALLHQPRVLFLDEPFEGIDPVASRSIQDRLTALAAGGTTILLTSHILPMIERLAQQILFLRRGRLVLNVPLQELTRSLEEVYFELVREPEAEHIA